MALAVEKLTPALPDLIGRVPHGPDTTISVPPETLEALISLLVRQRWARLAADYDHPLSVLYQGDEQPIQQWTMGWGLPSSDNPLGSLYLLIWQTDKFQTTHWRLFQDGELLGELPDNASATARHCHTLLEGMLLPVIEPEAILRRLSDYHIAPDLREAATGILDRVFANHPFIFERFKPALLAALAEDLDNPLWPTLDVLKIHRLSGKTPIVHLLKAALERGADFSVAEQRQCHDVLTRLQTQYDLLGHELHPLCLKPYGEAFQTFRALQTQGLWRIRLSRA